jgi:hypothetical protein
MIRLVTVIGHGINLLPHFIKHYQKYVDEIQIVCYNSDLHPNISSQVKITISKYENINIVKEVYHRNFDWQKVTDLYNEVKLTCKNEWWVVADIDEFHLYPNDDLQTLIEDCKENGWDIVRGGFIDRLGEGGSFPSIKKDKSIWNQFPIMGFFRYPMSYACPNKISVMKGWVTLTSGQHYAKIDEQTTWRWQGWNHPLIAPIPSHSVQVHHFKWDRTSIERVKKVADIDKEYSYSSEYLKMYEELKKSDFLINLDNHEYMIESDGYDGKYEKYKQWNKLIKKIISI